MSLILHRYRVYLLKNLPFPDLSSLNFWQGEVVLLAPRKAYIGGHAGFPLQKVFLDLILISRRIYSRCISFYSQAINTTEKKSAALMESMLLLNSVAASLLAAVAELPEAVPVPVAWLASLTAVGFAVAAPVLLTVPAAKDNGDEPEAPVVVVASPDPEADPEGNP